MQNLLIPRAVSLVCLGLVLAVPVPAAGQSSCLTFVPPMLFDTSWNPNPGAGTERVHNVDLLWWLDHRYLIYNTGNEVEIRQFDDADDPGPTSSSMFFVLHGGPVQPFGDRDYNLYNIAVCDDCSFGVAGYETQGSVIFEVVEHLGNALAFADFEHYPAASVVGAFTFGRAGQQYLVMNRLPDHCGSATLYLVNGIHQSNRQALQCLEAPDWSPMNVDGGFYIADGGDGSSYVYLVDDRADVHMYRIDGTGAALRLHYLGAVVKATLERGWGMRVDLDGPPQYPRLAVSGGFWGIETWDLTAPDSPELLASWNPSFIRPENRTAIAYPYVFAASLAGTGPGSTFMYDIIDPTSPQLLEPDFWLMDDDHPWNTFDYSNNQDGVLTADGSLLIFARYSVMQEIAIDCVHVAPVAAMTVEPSPARPGDTVTVTNTTPGDYTEAAVWVEDETGLVVVGTGAMQPDEPLSRQLVIPAAMPPDRAYTAWVAVANPHHPCPDPLNSPLACGDQVTSAPVVMLSTGIFADGFETGDTSGWSPR